MKEVKMDYKQLYLEELKRNYDLTNQLLSNIDTISCQNKKIEILEEENLRLKIKANVKKVSDIIHNKIEKKVEASKSFDPYYI